MTRFPENWTVQAGDSFAGETLTAKGAAVVNAHRYAVVNGQKEPIAKLVAGKLVNRKDMKPDELTAAFTALNSTPW